MYLGVGLDLQLAAMSTCYLAFLLCVLGATTVSYGQLDEISGYSNWWAVRVMGSIQEATDLAEERGFANLGEIGNLEGFYHFVSVDDGLDHTLREVEMQDQLTARLRSHTKVMYAEQQRLKVMETYTVPYYSAPTDPGWTKQWSLLNSNDDYKRDINVEPAWMQGVNGSGITVAIVDNGVDMYHDDLAPNFNIAASWDFGHNDSDPTPDDPDSEVAFHGTSCAGEVAMVKDNAVCGVGVAYASQIAALKFNASALTDIDNAKMWSYMNNNIDIYSNSFGPSDAGYVVEGPGHVLNLTLATAVQKGRNGKGSIFVMASGNGGLNDDSCAANGYASSIYTISVGSADQASYQAIYDEQCASKMVVTFSFNSSSFHERHNQMYTTVLNGKCNDSFTGTSASAPLVSATIALCLHANPNLTWRDIQYLLAYTSDPHILEDGGFQENGGALMVSHKFGFGALDAEAMVTRAKRWITVPHQLSYSTGITLFGNAYPGQPCSGTFNIRAADVPLTYLEHVMVTATVTVDGYNMSYSLHDYDTIKNTTNLTVEEERAWLTSPHPRRGDIKIELTSPSGTKSVLLPYRDLDFINSQGYQNWPFTSVQHWGENPAGMWTLVVTYRSSTGCAVLGGAGLTLYGTREVPQAVRNIPSDCDIACRRYCSGIGPGNCDACLIKRVSETLECVEECPNGTHLYKSHYCNPVETGDMAITTGDIATTTGENTGLPFHSMLVIIIGSTAGGVTLISIIVIMLCACCISWYKRKKRPTYVRLQFEEIPPSKPV